MKPLIKIFTIIMLIVLPEITNAQYAAPNSYQSGTGQLNTVVGVDAGRSNLISSINNMAGSWNSFFGTLSGNSNTTGYSNSFLGTNSGRNNTTGYSNSFFGAWAGNANTEGFQNSFFGNGAGENNTNGLNNTFVGFRSGFLNSFGSNNVAIGDSTLYNNGTGELKVGATGNVAIGPNAGFSNTLGASNTMIGSLAGRNNILGSNSVLLGVAAGANTNGSQNTMVGGYSGNQISSGNNNICIGVSSGPQTNGNYSNKLFIDIQNSNSPLIYGEFDNNLVRINGEFEAMGGMSQGSDVHSKEDIVEVDYNSILEKLDQLEIAEWQYIDFNDRRHIGPMAQDFHLAFGLGNDNTKISTLDADGVALAAIKALKQENEDLKKENSALSDRINKIEEFLKISNK